MKVYETELPGTGVRYTLKFDAGGELVVLIHNDGEREVFWRGEPSANSKRLFRLGETESRKLSDILDGTYFHPVDEGLDEVFENARIRWIHIGADSPVTGKTIGEAGIRSRTGVTILGLRRAGAIISEVDAGTRIEADDILVGVGSEDAHADLQTLLQQP